MEINRKYLINYETMIGLTLKQFTEAYNEYLQNQEKPKSEFNFYSPGLENEINKTIIELLQYGIVIYNQ